MSKVIEAKKQHVDTISEQFKASQSTVLVDYRGLTVAEMTELRKQLREAGVDFHVYKNTMTRRAAEACGFTEINEFLTGPNAIAFSNDDIIAPARVLHNFAKEHEALEIKAGIIEGNFAPVEDIKALATLPSHEGLVSMFLSVLQAPVRNFAYAVKAVSESKEENEASAE